MYAEAFKSWKEKFRAEFMAEGRAIGIAYGKAEGRAMAIAEGKAKLRRVAESCTERSGMSFCAFAALCR